MRIRTGLIAVAAVVCFGITLSTLKIDTTKGRCVFTNVTFNCERVWSLIPLTYVTYDEDPGTLQQHDAFDCRWNVPFILGMPLWRTEAVRIRCKRAAHSAVFNQLSRASPPG